MLFFKGVLQCVFARYFLILYTVRAPLQPAACIFFTPFFSAVYNQEWLFHITDNICTKQGNSSVFGPKIRGYDGACTVHM